MSECETHKTLLSLRVIVMIVLTFKLCCTFSLFSLVQSSSYLFTTTLLAWCVWINRPFFHSIPHSIHFSIKGWDFVKWIIWSHFLPLGTLSIEQELDSDVTCCISDSKHKRGWIVKCKNCDELEHSFTLKINLR